MHVHFVGFLVIFGPEAFRDLVTPRSGFCALEEGIFIESSCLPAPVFTIATQASMLEVKSGIALQRGVEVGEENDVGNDLHVITECLGFSISLNLEDGLALLNRL